VTSNSKISAREHNLQSILHLLDTHQALSAKQLSTLTGLSVVSINKLIELLEQKIFLPSILPIPEVDVLKLIK
jgi:HTH domain.